MQPMHSSNQPTGNIQLKESIRDIIRLQQEYQLSDDLFWEIFNARVLLNEHINVDSFLFDLQKPVVQA